LFPSKEADVTPHLARGLSLLLVDDDADLACVLSRWAAWVGVSMDVAPRGAEALRLVMEKRYDAVLLDLTLPDMEGSTVYERLVEMCPILAPRIIIFTGGAANGRAWAFLKGISCPVVLKPFDLMNLSRQIAVAQSAVV
jgi:CheY-like chemotaxis protein